MQIRLSIVLLNYNRLDETRATLLDLQELTSQRSDIEVIAVDNGSQDGTARFIAAQQSWLVPVLLGDNGGIAGYNHGFKRARGDLLMVLDDDSCPAGGETLDRVIAVMDARPEVGVIACRIETPDARRQWSWHLPKVDRAGPSMSFIGCGFVIRRHLFREIGWYPERFFLYQNEIPVAIGARSKGWSIRYDPRCRVIHRGEIGKRPNWRRIYFPTRNTIWLIRRYFPRLQGVYLITSRLAIGFVRSLYMGEFPCYLRAALDGMRETIQPEVLPPSLRREFAPFWRQNSLWHQLLRRT